MWLYVVLYVLKTYDFPTVYRLKLYNLSLEIEQGIDRVCTENTIDLKTVILLESHYSLFHVRAERSVHRVVIVAVSGKHRLVNPYQSTLDPVADSHLLSDLTAGLTEVVVRDCQICSVKSISNILPNGKASIVSVVTEVVVLVKQMTDRSLDNISVIAVEEFLSGKHRHRNAP